MVGACRPDGTLRVVGEEGRDLERDPAVDAGGAIVDGAEEIGGLRQVLERQGEEQRLAGLALVHQATNRLVVVGAALDRVVEDGRVRGQARDRQLVAIALEGPAGEELARDVVEPEALAELVELLCRFHGSS
jgi:hypothetical protein